MVTKLLEKCNLSGGDFCWRVVRAINVIFALIGVFLLSYWALDRSPPNKLYDMGSLTPSVVHPGQVVKVHWIISKDRLCPGTAVRTLSGECGAHMLYVGESFLQEVFKDPKITQFNFEVPKSVTPGACYYRVTIYYRCNPLHNWWPLIFSYPPIPFKVEVP